MIVAAPGNRQTAQVGIADITQLGDGTQTTGWFSDNGANVGGYMVDLDQPDVARTLDRLATVRGMAAERLALYILESDGTTRLACELTTPVGWYSRPSWSPDGRTLTYSDNQGLWTIAVPDDWATTCNLHPTLLAPGASDAGWSNADLSAPSTSGGSETPGQPGSSGTTSGGQVSGSVQGPPASRLQTKLFSVRALPRRRGLLITAQATNAAGLTVNIARCHADECHTITTLRRPPAVTQNLALHRRLAPGTYRISATLTSTAGRARAIRIVHIG